MSSSPLRDLERRAPRPGRAVFIAVIAPLARGLAPTEGIPECPVDLNVAQARHRTKAALDPPLNLGL